MKFSRQVRAAMILDLGEVRRSKWLPFASATYLLLVGLLVLAGMRESSVLGYTGMSRTVLSLAHVLLVVLPLLALSATAQVINRAREDGSLELLFSQPLSRSAYLVGVTISRSAVLVVPLVLTFAAMATAGLALSPEDFALGVALRAAATCSALVVAFVGVGLLVSSLTRQPTRALVLALVAWAAAVAFLDLGLIGLMLQWRLSPELVFLLAAINPVEAARVALLYGIEPDLGTFGPVGFHLVHHVGAAALLALGVAWPLLVGGVSWSLALLRFGRGDLV